MRIKPRKTRNEKLKADIAYGIETGIILMKMAGASKEDWLSNMAKAWDETEIPAEVTSHHGVH